MKEQYLRFCVIWLLVVVSEYSINQTLFVIASGIGRHILSSVQKHEPRYRPRKKGVLFCYSAILFRWPFVLLQPRYNYLCLHVSKNQPLYAPSSMPIVTVLGKCLASYCIPFYSRGEKRKKSRLYYARR